MAPALRQDLQEEPSWLPRPALGADGGSKWAGYGREGRLSWPQRLTRGGQPLPSRVCVSAVLSLSRDQVSAWLWPPPGTWAGHSPRRRELVRKPTQGPHPHQPCPLHLPHLTQSLEQVLVATFRPEPNFLSDPPQSGPRTLGTLALSTLGHQEHPLLLPSTPVQRDQPSRLRQCQGNKEGPHSASPTRSPAGPQDGLRAHLGWAPFTKGEMLESFPGARPHLAHLCASLFTPAG